jgi:dephospho-CoA kinase
MTHIQELIKKYVIAITGSIATGKSTLAHLIKNVGYTVYDADELSREVVQKGTLGLKILTEQFGPEIILPTGDLDRKALGKIIFNSEEHKKKLESILHPLIKEAFYSKLEQSKWNSNPKLIFYEASLIFEAQKELEFKEIWVTHVPLDVQKQRLMQRDGLDSSEALKKIHSQWPSEKKAKQADKVFDMSLPKDEILTMLYKILS